MKYLRLFTRATTDTRTRILGRSSVRDEILHADPVPKLLLMPTTWRGDLKPVLDAYLQQLEPLTNGFSSGKVLHAEEIGSVLDLGTQWLGTFRDRLLAAPAGTADAGEVLKKLDELREMMQVGDRQMITDALRRLRRAADHVNAALFGSHCEPDEDRRRGAFSEGRRVADGLMRHHMGDFSRPVSIRALNAHNAAFWRKHSVTPSVDPGTGKMHWRGGDAASRTAGLRDAVYAQAHAKTPGDRLRAMNDAARCFWSGSGEPPTDALARMPPPTSVAGINARNRKFWAGRA